MVVLRNTVHAHLQFSLVSEDFKGSAAKCILNHLDAQFWEPLVRHHSRVEVHHGVVYGIHGLMVLGNEGGVEAAEGVQFKDGCDLTGRELSHHRRLRGPQFGRSMGKVPESGESALLIVVHDFQPSCSTCEIEHVAVEFLDGKTHGLARRPCGGQVLHVVRPQKRHVHCLAVERHAAA